MENNRGANLRTPKLGNSNLEVSAIGFGCGGSPAQVALAWLLAEKPWIVPIPGPTKLARLEDNRGAADAELTAEDVRAREDAWAKIKLEGARYPTFHEQLAGRGSAVPGGEIQNEAAAIWGASCGCGNGQFHSGSVEQEAGRRPGKTDRGMAFSAHRCARGGWQAKVYPSAPGNADLYAGWPHVG